MHLAFSVTLTPRKRHGSPDDGVVVASPSGKTAQFRPRSPGCICDPGVELLKASLLHHGHKPLNHVSQANQVGTSAFEFLHIGSLLLRELFLRAQKQPNRLMGFVAAKWRWLE